MSFTLIKQVKNFLLFKTSRNNSIFCTYVKIWQTVGNLRPWGLVHCPLTVQRWYISILKGGAKSFTMYLPFAPIWALGEITLSIWSNLNQMDIVLKPIGICNTSFHNCHCGGAGLDCFYILLGKHCQFVAWGP